MGNEWNGKEGREWGMGNVYVCGMRWGEGRGRYAREREGRGKKKKKKIEVGNRRK